MRDDRTRRYALGPAVRTLANAHIGTLDWAERATPLLRELVTVTGETANLAVLDRTRAVVVAQAQSTRMVRMFAELGNRMPLHCTGCGKVLLAHFPDSAVAAIIAETGLPPSTPSSIGSLEELREELARIRRRGYVVDNEEREEGLRCVAVPVRDAAGDVVAAISIAGHQAGLTMLALSRSRGSCGVSAMHWGPLMERPTCRQVILMRVNEPPQEPQVGLDCDYGRESALRNDSRHRLSR